MRIGRIVAVEDFPQARRPAWKLRIDFGPELGEKRSSAQITTYQPAPPAWDLRGIDRFQRRGRSAVRSEWRLITATHDLLKLHTHQFAITAP